MWKAGNINVRTALDDLDLIHFISNFQKANLDIVTLTEFRRKNSGSLQKNGYDIYWSGPKTAGRSEHGVAIAIRCSKFIQVHSIEPISSRLMSAEITISGTNIKIVAAYGPTEKRSDSLKDEFWRQLKKAVEVGKKQKLLLMGDLNAQTTLTSRPQPTNFHGQFIEDQHHNNNGERLVNFIYESRNFILNTCFRHRPIHKYTWYSNDGKTRRTLDYVISAPYLRKCCTDVRVRNSYDFKSDHRLQVASFRTPKSGTPPIKTRPKPKPKKVDFKNLTKQEIDNYCSKLEQEIHSVGSDINVKQLISCLDNASKQLPKVGRTKAKSQPWDDDETLKELLAERKKFHNKKKFRRQYRHLSRQIKRHCGRLKNKFHAEEALELNLAVESKNIGEAYTIAKRQKSLIRGKPKAMTCSGLDEHFQQHFNKDFSEKPTPIELQKPHPKPKINPNLLDESPPSRDEVVSAVKKLKANKASLDVAGELLQISLTSDIFVDALVEFYDTIWTVKTVPSHFGLGKITAIFKNKGSAKDPSKYRGITVSSVIGTVVVKIILKRLINHYDLALDEGQMGFRPNRGTVDGIYCLKRVQQWAVRQQKQVYCLMVDLSAAFDHLHRQWLFTAVKLLLGENSSMVAILESIYNQTSCYLQDPKKQFTTTVGVRQGGCESPYLYNIYANHCMDVFTQKCKDAGIKGLDIPFNIPESCSDIDDAILGLTMLIWLGYADDLVLVTADQQTIQKMLDLLDETFSAYGLAINDTKTETLILNFKGEDEKYPKSIISMRGQSIKNVKTFRYLGATIMYNNCSTGDVEITNRLSAAKSKFFELKQLFTNHKVKLATRQRFFDSLVRSRLTYGSQAWVLTQKQKDRLQSEYVHLQRFMVKGGFQRRQNKIEYETKTGRKSEFSKILITNEEIGKICGSEPISKFIERQQANWIGHVARAEDGRYIKQLTFEGKTNNKLKRGVTDTTLRQVSRKYQKTLNYEQDLMLKKMVAREI